MNFKILNTLNKLNGWKRIWLVISIIYLIIVAAGAVLTMPKESDITTEWANELVPRVSILHPELNTHLDFETRDIYSNYTDMQYIKAMHHEYKNVVSFSDIDIKYKSQLDHLFYDQLKWLGVGFIIWLLPVTVLYLFGWSIGWIYRGFTVSNK